jgi:hypothetical protein
MLSQSPIPRHLLRSTTSHDKESTASIEPPPPHRARIIPWKTVGHPASCVRPWQPSAPPPISVTIAVDACLFACAGLMALAAAPWWSFVLPLVPGAAILIVYGWKAATALGIRSGDETPPGWLIALAVPSGLAGALAAHAGRYAGLVLVAYLACAHIGERIVWSRFRATFSQMVGER